jgi:hypothetical protein
MPKKKSRQGTTANFRVRRELVQGQLNAAVMRCDIEDRELPCWGYATAGLEKYKQREVALMLVKRPGERDEAYPHGPFTFFRMLWKDAKAGRIVKEGDVTVFEESGFFGFAAVAYVDGLGAGGLAAIGLTADELECAQAFGSQRVFSLLSKAERFFPVPYWTERGRPSRVSMREMRTSVLVPARRLHDSGFSVFREDGRVVMVARNVDQANGALSLLIGVPPERAVAILTEMHPACDAALRWEPGQSGPSANGARGGKATRLCGSFVIVRLNQPQDDARVVEDGFVVSLTAESWAKLHSALSEQADVDLPSCSLEWLREEAPETENVEATVEATPAPTRSWRRRILLKESQEQLAQAVDLNRFMGFVVTVDLAVMDVFSTDTSKGELRISVSIDPPGLTKYYLGRKGAMVHSSMERLWEELSILPPLFVTKPVSFLLEFDVGERRRDVAV